MNKIELAQTPSKSNIRAGQFYLWKDEVYVLALLDSKYALISLNDGEHWDSTRGKYPLSAFRGSFEEFRLVSGPFTITPDIQD